VAISSGWLAASPGDKTQIAHTLAAEIRMELTLQLITRLLEVIVCGPVIVDDGDCIVKRTRDPANKARAARKRLT
jgi:hypothetical protein